MSHALLRKMLAGNDPAGILAACDWCEERGVEVLADGIGGRAYDGLRDVARLRAAAKAASEAADILLSFAPKGRLELALAARHCVRRLPIGADGIIDAYLRTRREPTVSFLCWRLLPAPLGYDSVQHYGLGYRWDTKADAYTHRLAAAPLVTPGLLARPDYLHRKAWAIAKALHTEDA